MALARFIMFDELLRQLDKLSRGVKIPVTVPLDEDSYLDRQCPAHHCRTQFKVHFEDWKAKVKDDSVFCPICGKEAPADAWNTSEQGQHLRNIAFAHIKDTFDRALAIDVRHFNSGQRPGFVQL
jgi:hypothetical protein